MKRLMIAVVFVGLILSGCASATGPKWCKPGATSDDYVRDRSDCHGALRGTGKIKHDFKFFMSQCLKEKGWSECKKEE